jgi:hypothetical protein
MSGHIPLITCWSGLLLSTAGPSLVLCAYGDGFAEETLPPFSVNGQKFVLNIKVSPPGLTVQDRQDRLLEINVFDYVTEEIIQNISYQVTVSKNNKIILGDRFHSEAGPLALRIEPAGNTVMVTNFTSRSGGIWNTNTGKIAIQGPIFLYAGLYHISIKVLSLGLSSNIVRLPSDGVLFDSWLSVAEVNNNIIKADKNVYNITVISYYDDTTNFTYSEKTNAVSWMMPFNGSALGPKHQNFLVHQEVLIPNNLFNGTPFQYKASLNGQELTGRSLMIDPFSDQNNNIVHLLLNKADIRRILTGETEKASNKIMLFTVEMLRSGSPEGSSELTTDNGQLEIVLHKNPDRLKSNSGSILSFSFLDPETGDPFPADITYDISILDQNGKSILNQTGTTLLYNTEGTSEVTFPTKGIYQIVISIKGLAPLDSDSLDTSRNSIARGNLVVE